MSALSLIDALIRLVPKIDINKSFTTTNERKMHPADETHESVHLDESMTTYWTSNQLRPQHKSTDETKDNHAGYHSEHTMLKTDEETSHYVFFYGSCSPQNILQESGVMPLQSYAAIVPGYVRYFARFSHNRNGGTASIRKATDLDKPYNSVSGWVAKLSDVDLYSMDCREGHPVVYKREYVSVDVHLNISNTKHIIKVDNVWTYFVVDCTDWIVPPSHLYSNLCCLTIQHFWDYTNPIVIRNGKYPLYEIDNQGKATRLLIFDHFPKRTETHKEKFGVVASKSTHYEPWTTKRQCIRCSTKTWVCFVHNIALFICNSCIEYYQIVQK
eukprot:407200_1